MHRYKRLFGILGIAGAFLLCVSAVATMVFYKAGFSPLSGFFNELGHFVNHYFAAALPLIFNLSLVLFGLLFSLMMVYHGLCEATVKATALGFFGALTGILAAAQGIVTINYAEYHYIVSAAFYCSLFVQSALYVIFSLMERGKKPLASVIVAALAGICGAVFAAFILSGSMSRYLIDAASLSGRGFMPFALVGWAAAALVVAFTVLFGVQMIAGGKSAAFEESKPAADLEL